MVESAEELRKQRDTARRVAAEAMRELDDDQLSRVRQRLDEGESDEHERDGTRAPELPTPG